MSKDLKEGESSMTFKLVGAASKDDPTETNLAGVDDEQNALTINQSIGTPLQTPPLKTTVLGGWDQINNLIRRLLCDIQGRLLVSTIGGVGAGFNFGDVSSTSTAQKLVNRTTYTGQTTNAQRSIASSSASDTGAGTGARKVRLTYLDQAGAGPFTEDVTLNGTTYVNTTNTNICFIEKIEVIEAGTGGVNVGILTLKAATGGGGATIGTVNAGDNKTFWSHHYVPDGKECNITGISCGHNGTTVGSGALFILEAIQIGVSNPIFKQISDFVRLYGQSSTFSRTYQSPIKVQGPAFIRMKVTPESSSSFVYRGSFDYFEP